jgi:hypothetical protein
MINILDILPDGYISIYISYQLSQKFLNQYKNLNSDCQQVLEIAKEYLDDPKGFSKSSLVEELSRKFLSNEVKIDISENSFHWIIHCLKYILNNEYTVGLLFNIQSAIEFSFRLHAREDLGIVIHNIILDNFDFILEYKLKNNQAFRDCEKIFPYLNLHQKKLMLFNLDILANQEMKNRFPYVIF